ncbi:MarR family transcriptional regulator [Pseudomonas sp. Fl5BN2]|uniref:MarR family winged helix-turn-helix transcriptional regulator n=1 Tax=unclassified Pseudomonas TaxID=196821 RepID=UPI001377FA7A|nr:MULTISPECIES: MarR family transcriptional regulator [unclassified Pseudomonas]NBF06563.1 MarR family transcriptional regulator [Pseudomonas sp. Fl5BN2]NBF11833.1 MarR family transcriptional regulator [Pseudomonas sp. Fl4BN1]
MTAPTPLDEPGPLENALSRLQCVLVARRARYTPEAVSWSQYDILELLRLQGRMTPSQLGERLGVARTGVSKALRVLKDLGLVTQAQGGGDRREQLTLLTDSGRDFLARAASGRHDAAQRVLAALTQGEQAIFTELCEKACSALETQGEQGQAVRP